MTGCDHLRVLAPELTPLAAATLRLRRSPERALEIGCEDGDGTLFLAREFPQARVRGLDPSAERIREATARVGLDPEGRVAFKAGKARALPYPDDFFDLVVRVDGSVSGREVARVLRAGGHLILARTRQTGDGFGFSPWWLRRRLARQGIEEVESGDAGAGSFFVGRLTGDD